MQSEASGVAGPGIHAVPGGGDALYLERALNALAPKATGLVSWGLAGGLNPEVMPGDWIVGDRVVGGFVFNSTASWASRARSVLDSAKTTPGRVWTGPIHAETVLADPKVKRRLGRSGALGIDMESHVAARVAAAHDLPFLILRVVSDGVDDELPPAALVAMGPRGKTNYAAIVRSLATEPRQLRAFGAFARSATDALTTLRHGRRALGGSLGLVAANLGEAATYVI